MLLFSYKYLIYFVAICHCGFGAANRNDGVLEKLKNGLKYARNYLETAKEIADLVANSLKQNNNDKKRGDEYVKNDKMPKGNYYDNLTSAFFRLLGLDSPKIAAITVNSAIFLAQLINSLMKDNKEVNKESEENINKDESNFDPLKFVMNTRNERIQNLLKQSQNPQLPEQIIDHLDVIDSSCVRLLMCKITPIILHAQESLKNKTVNRKFDLTSWLPDKQLFEDNGDNCEEKFLDCKIFPDE
ncbi:hypothetical protein PV327_006853 [Microctonus hyperodae]|uniref:Uncharacterized protein n=1 Tax=Microctonus hyperodae TaxID=165561 RepID=A0AA39F583_MICHY|nr:hypothetical protein PV327_006853 [Microctonus hyperodae]